MRYFVTVVEAGTITAAAERLHMSQPPLSTAMSQLEREVGAQLLVRLPRGVEPTQAGEVFLARARRILGDVERMGAEVRSVGEGLGGSLRVGAEPVGHWNVVGHAAAAFTRAHPEVDLVLGDAPPDGLLAQLRAGDLDLMIVPSIDPDGITSRIGGDVEAARVVRLPFLVVVAADRRGEFPPGPVPLRDLVGETWIMPRAIPRLPIIPEAMDAAFLAAAGSLPARVRRVSTPNTALPLVAAGLGLGVVTPGIADHLSTVVALEVEEGLPWLHLVAVWPRAGIAAPVRQRFVEVLLEAGAAL